jgi:hypothetical protein
MCEWCARIVVIFAGNIEPGIEMWRSSASGAIHTGNRQHAETPMQEMILPVEQKKTQTRPKMRLCVRQRAGDRAHGYIRSWTRRQRAEMWQDFATKGRCDSMTLVGANTLFPSVGVGAFRRIRV